MLSNLHAVDSSEFIMMNVLQFDQRIQLNYFEVLVAIILSQNTSDKNAIKAFNNLKGLVKEISPENILALDKESLMSAIRVAGLATRKSCVLKELAYILRSNPTLLKDIALLNAEDARKKLLELPGVGLKTADVFLLLTLKKATFPIDTHVDRILRRLGIAKPREKYEDIRLKIVNYLGNDIDSLLKLHVLLIVHGRRVCTSRKPKCSKCTIAELCCRIIQ